MNGRICTPMVNAVANYIRAKLDRIDQEIKECRPTFYALRLVLNRDRHELSCILEDLVETYPELKK